MNNTLYIGQRDEKGRLTNEYRPFQNLINKDTKLIEDFQTENLHFDLEHPVDIIPQESYDGAINLVINDDKNPPRLINSRFSVLNDTNYLIPEHYGFKDSNVYDDNTFDVDTRLKAIYTKIPALTFNGLENHSGKLPCGSYTFHFKFVDVDGNESEICQESGIVQVHIGDTPDDSRMGMENEDSGKAVKFTLTNIDTGFDYIRVIFSRVSSGDDLAKSTTYHKVLYDYPIVNGVCIVTISGYESILGISLEEFYINYADINSVKTQTVSNNVLTFGNITKTEHDWEELKRISWRIIPYQVEKTSENKTGTLNTIDYNEVFYAGKNLQNNYYNAKNVYESVGYWPDEIYRLGIVYIFDDNSLSPVFNLLGRKLQAFKTFNLKDDNNSTSYIRKFFEFNGSCRDYEPGNSENELDGNKNYEENSFFFDNGEELMNSKGVIKTVKTDPYILKGGVLESKPQSIYFDFNYINAVLIDLDPNDDKDEIKILQEEDVFKKHHIIGFFFVRQKRVPTIIALGMVIGLTDRFRGSLPVIKYANKYYAQSFISPARSLRDKGTFIPVEASAVRNLALLVPDAEMSEALFNDLFVSNDYCLEAIGKFTTLGLSAEYSYATKYDSIEATKEIVKLTNVVEDTESTTNGEDFFSTRAGNASEPYKTKDVKLPWRWSLPQELTESTSVVRGMWGPFVGMSRNSFEYGTLVNIKKSIYLYENADKLEFKRRFTDLNPYHAITHWLNIEDVKPYVEVYRGDCFSTLFTHRMNRNFVDPELPTNTLIVDPSCWARNYGVRCTAEILLHAHSNLTKDSEGWYVQDPSRTPAMDWATFAVLIATGNLIGALLSLKNLNRSDKDLNKIAGVNSLTDHNDIEYNAAANIEQQEELDKEDLEMKESLPEWALKYYPNGFANEIVLAFETHLTRRDKRSGDWLKQKVNPKEQEQQGGFNLKAIFKSDDSWELHGLASINRADVNAVALGQWITFPICSNFNYSFRDIDFSNATEEASFHKKRSFYPLLKLNPHSPLRDSNVINYGAKISIPEKNYFIFPNVPFLKLEYFTRVYNSLRDSSTSFTNEYKQIFENCYKDYDKQYGLITKLVAIPNAILVVFSHGIGLIQITNELESKNFLSPITMISTDFGSIWKDSVKFTSRGVTGDYAVYGVDTVAKKIWKYSPSGLELISDHRVGKFLIDNIDMTEFIKGEYVGHINVKTHYNAFKHDVIFTYYNDKPYLLYERNDDGIVERVDIIPGIRTKNAPKKLDSEIEIKLIGKDDLVQWKKDQDFNNFASFVRSRIDTWKDGKCWSLCYNEDTKMFTTFYDWYPVESENIDNVFFSYDRLAVNDIELTWRDYKVKKDLNKYAEYESPEGLKIWKHGLSGLYKTEKIKPTNWYGLQHEFNFEFVVNKTALILKIFNNLKMIANKVEPMKLEFEVVGEGYDWYEYKEVLGWIYNHPEKDGFKEVLSKDYGTLRNENFDFPTLFDREDDYRIKKLPYLKVKEAEVPGIHYSERYRSGETYNPPGNTTDKRIPVNKEKILTSNFAPGKSDAYRENSSVTMLVHDDLLNEYRIRTEQLGNNIKKYGRTRGNMEYLEDLWDVEIRPISFKWIYLNSNGELAWSRPVETRLRDKYIKVKVRYTGKDLAVIQAILTMYDYSYA